MLGIQEKKEKISLWNGVLCPRIKGKVKVVEEMCKTCEVSFAGDGKELVNFFSFFCINYHSTVSHICCYWYYQANLKLIIMDARRLLTWRNALVVVGIGL